MAIISKFVFGFDIDGVLTFDDDGQDNLWLKAASEYFGEPIKRRSYYVEDAFDRTREEVEEFYKACIRQIFSTVPARELAGETLRSLEARGCTIHLITHRSENFREITETWLRQHRIPYHSLTMTSPNQGDYSKGQRCVELGVEFFVDDKFENAEEVAACGVYSLLFHASHNAGRSTHLPVVKDWQDVQEHIQFFFQERLRQVR